jgi:hypothetical protein
MLYYILFIVVLAYFFGQVEIQIEGPNGWAKNLPTWRIEKHWLLDVFFGGRAMTGYHAWALSFILLFFHLPFAFAVHWSWSGEARALGGLAVFWATEDFLWFVINPAYGIKKFKKEHVPWHPRWVLYLPLDYWIFLPLGVFLIWFSFR